MFEKKKKDDEIRVQKIEDYYYKKNMSVFDFKQQMQEKRDDYQSKLQMSKMESNERAMLLRNKKLKAIEQR